MGQLVQLQQGGGDSCGVVPERVSHRAKSQRGRVVQLLNPVDPWLKSAWFQSLNILSHLLVSKFAFKLNLYRYNAAGLYDANKEMHVRAVTFEGSEHESHSAPLTGVGLPLPGC
jgi:hypothetical protein